MRERKLQVEFSPRIHTNRVFRNLTSLFCGIGQHRQFGTHITKIKSVNLDKWPEGKVELMQALTNNLVNSYWEATMSKNFNKPGPNASGNEVNRFLNEKYVQKKWVDPDMKYDPVYMYENKKSKFDRWVKRRLAAVTGTGGDESDSPREKKPSS